MSKFNDGAELDFIKVITLHNDGEFSTHASVEPYPLGVIEHGIKESPTKSCFSSRPSDDHSEYMEQVYTSEVMKFAGLPSDTTEVTLIQPYILDGLVPIYYTRPELSLSKQGV